MAMAWIKPNLLQYDIIMVEVLAQFGEKKITRESVGKITVIGENDCLAKITQEQ